LKYSIFGGNVSILTFLLLMASPANQEFGGSI
jgi:hypothetical protein